MTIRHRKDSRGKHGATQPDVRDPIMRAESIGGSHSYQGYRIDDDHTLPPVEKTPLLALRFSAKASQRLQDLVLARFHDCGLVTLDKTGKRDHHGSENTVVLITATQKALETEAELIHLVKPLQGYSPPLMDRFTVQRRLRFCRTRIPYRDQYGLFSAAEWSLLADRLLDSITVLPEDEDTSELSNMLGSYQKQQRRKSFSFREHGEQSASLRQVLQTFDLLEAVSAVHLPLLQKRVTSKILQWNRLSPPVDLIQSYYGWEIGFYYAWMGMLSRWLVVPGILGGAVFLFRWYRNDTIDTDEYTPFYGLFVFLWAVLFLRFWDRYENRLSLRWGTYLLSPYERQKYFAVRPEFRGLERTSPVTGLEETYYPPYRRRLKYVVGALITFGMLSIAFVVMILSINLTGSIDPSTNPNRWNDQHPHPFYVPELAKLAQPGHIFDQTSQWRCYLPVLIHVSAIRIMNIVYGKVAQRLTEWENHETKLSHNSSLILKRFLFEAIDAYLSLFYLAFYERDVERLRTELMSVYQVDTLRRVIVECLIPMIIQRVTIRGANRHYSAYSPKVRMDHHANIPTMEAVQGELEKDHYEQFDDYLEFVIQLGYVTLFASAYPVASLVSIAANWVEVRADSYKVANLCRRMSVLRSSSLGTWRDLMACIIWLSALTNCLLAGFTSDQLMHYMPRFYEQDQLGYTDMGHANSWIVVFVIFGMERLLIVIGLLIHAFVPAVPEDVSDQLERQHYVKAKEHEMALSSRSLKKEVKWQ